VVLYALVRRRQVIFAVKSRNPGQASAFAVVCPLRLRSQA
jgi:hypothetical protein